MPIRIATFNVENLFSRARAINDPDPVRNKKILADIAELNRLIAKASYSAADKAAMEDILVRNQVTKPSVRPFFVNEFRGRLFKSSNGIQITAAGRGSWEGFIDSEREPLDRDAIRNTGGVIQKVNADVWALVEVESRPTLLEFNKVFIDKGYDHAMLIDGNDSRGIDVAMLGRLPVRNMRSHVDDRDGGKNIFSRDCPEIELITPSGKPLWLLSNHLLSKFGGDTAAKKARRKLQATRVRDIVLANFNLSTDLVVVAGDLNDTPDSDPLKPLLTTPGLHDVLDKLPSGAPRFTYRSPKNQIDYMLVSTPLFAKLTHVEIERHDMLTAGFDQAKLASDHAAIVADFNV